MNFFLAIFVIDSNKKMFDELVYADGLDQEANSLFDLSLGVIEELFLAKLRQSNSNQLVNLRAKLFPVLIDFYFRSQSYSTTRKNQILKIALSHLIIVPFSLHCNESMPTLSATSKTPASLMITMILRINMDIQQVQKYQMSSGCANRSRQE